jgi:CYTH domain-containing protein
MEIERKWMVSGWPEDVLKDVQLPFLFTELQEQGYLHTNVPIVRIRREERRPADLRQSSVRHVLCIKSAGRLVRQEVEMEIPAEQFGELRDMIGKPLIQKVRKVYQLPDGHSLEVNLVDEGLPSEFMYAEVEFESVEEARIWDPAASGLGSYLDDDVTEKPGQSMSAYWMVTRELIHGLD